MEINSTTNTTSYVNTTQTEKAQQSTTENKTVNTTFDIVTLENKSPTEITYTEYKNLDEEDIEQLFPKESMPEEYSKAVALHTKANYSEDEILNQVLFDKELEFSDSEVDTYVSHSLDFLTKTWDLIKEPPVIDERYIDLMNIPPNTEPLTQETLDAIEADRKRWEEWSKEDKIPANFLFSAFKHMKEEFFEHEEYYKDSTSTFRVHGREIFAIHASIQQEYEKRVSEQNATLDAYTKNNKQSPDLG